MWECVKHGFETQKGQVSTEATISPTEQTPLIAGNDKISGGNPSVAATLAAFDAMVSPHFQPGYGYYEIGKFETGGAATQDDITLTFGADQTTGTWSYNGGDTPFIVVYKASPGFIGQYFKGGISGNMFDLADLDGASIINPGGNVPGLSHLSLYAVDGVEISPPVSAVPLPAGGLLMLTAFGAFAVQRRRQKA